MTYFEAVFGYGRLLQSPKVIKAMAVQHVAIEDFELLAKTVREL
jgi:hypothetical protein